MSDDEFFLSVPAFSNFLEVSDPKHYISIPNDWTLIITDVRNSTQAIEQGRYKDVNMVGAAGITATLNACRPLAIPYVFGGDGATILIPSNLKEKIIPALLATRYLCKMKFNLDLRIGVIPVAEIRKRGGEIKVARYQPSNNIFLAMFSGGGLNIAENMVKKESGYCLEEENTEPPDLTGLSCRWEPFSSENGKMLSLLVLAKNPAIYNDILKDIKKIMGNEFNSPAKQSTMNFKWPPTGLLSEAKMQAKNLPVWLYAMGLYIFTLLAYVVLKRNKPAGDFNPETYKKSVIENADYQKFDDMLRMVVDLKEEQIEKICDYLEKLKKEGKIFYGMHVSDTALMTCLVFSTNDDGHVHFIDGGDGGYAAAAKQLKLQMKTAKP